MSGKRVKHALRKLTYLRELHEDKKAMLKFISGEVNPADIFSKCLPGARFLELRKMLLGDDGEEEPEGEGQAHYTPREESDPSWISGWENYTGGRAAVVDPDLLCGP